MKKTCFVALLVAALTGLSGCGGSTVDDQETEPATQDTTSGAGTESTQSMPAPADDSALDEDGGGEGEGVFDIEE